MASKLTNEVLVTVSWGIDKYEITPNKALLELAEAYDKTKSILVGTTIADKPEPEWIIPVRNSNYKRLGDEQEVNMPLFS